MNRWLATVLFLVIVTGTTILIVTEGVAWLTAWAVATTLLCAWQYRRHFVGRP